MVNRTIALPQNDSFFLLGPRQTGKSTLIRDRYSEGVWKVDLLLSDIYLPYLKDPALFRRQAIEKIKQGTKIIFIDEVQRVPELLNEVQALMSAFKEAQFILTGSSARKLKRGGANLLAGRAVTRYLFPFTYFEIEEAFDIEEILQLGSLPALFHKTREQKIDILKTYAQTYLKEEIQSEGLARNLGSFSKFLDLAASQFGELVSYSAIGRECHLAVSTVKSYYEILEDTLIGFRLEPWRKSIRKRLAGHPKFYFFDTGVTNALNRQLTGPLETYLRGRLFEQWVALETYRMLHYQASEARLYFWRTNYGAEVDLLLEKRGEIQAAIEIKASSNITGAHLSGLRSFREEHPKVPCYLIAQTPQPYEIDEIKILPWQEYLRLLRQLL